MLLTELQEALQKSWCKETAYDAGDWSKENPAIGQCAVTALIVNDYFGGEIVWAEAVQPDGRKISHYFNLIDGKEVDITRTQFPEGTIIPQGAAKTKEFKTTREFMLSNDNTKKRYEVLKELVSKRLNIPVPVDESINK